MCSPCLVSVVHWAYLNVFFGGGEGGEGVEVFVAAFYDDEIQQARLYNNRPISYIACIEFEWFLLLLYASFLET